MQILQKAHRTAIAMPRFLLQGLQADPFQAPIDGADDPTRRHRVRFTDRMKEVHRGLPLEWQSTRDALVKNHSKGEGIDGRSQFRPLPSCLLRGHVVRSTDDIPGLGEVSRTIDPSRQTEIG